jgi:phage tail-like protein
MALTDLLQDRVFDLMQSHMFWLIDISPNLNPPFFVFSPLLGFNKATGMSLEAEVETYQPWNSHFRQSYVVGATVGTVTLERGARITDTDFYRWVDRAINGVDQFRRNLLLIHFTSKGTTISDIPLPLVGSLRVPGRCWILWGTIPLQYSPGDLDASAGEVVMQSLTLQPEAITEVALGAVI